MLKYFHVPTFIISLAIGIFIVYIQVPEYTTIYVYPNPDNEDKLIYKDRSDMCYKFKSEEVSCPNDITKIREYPIQ
tara:strand:+ start:47 stop:274 length:228 start_codon:yes stop_codon:yes gene_type:complete